MSSTLLGSTSPTDSQASASSFGASVAPISDQKVPCASTVAGATSASRDAIGINPSHGQEPWSESKGVLPEGFKAISSQRFEELLATGIRRTFAGLPGHVTFLLLERADAPHGHYAIAAVEYPEPGAFAHMFFVEALPPTADGKWNIEGSWKNFPYRIAS